VGSGSQNVLGGVEMTNEIEKIVEFKIKRYDPQGKRRYTSTYKVSARKGMTILDALLYIKDNVDETLTFRHSCRMGICGSCGVNVNGKPVPACYTQILDLNSDSLLIEPLSNMSVIKDLVVDIDPFFEKYRKIKTVLTKPEQELANPTEFPQSQSELKKYWDLTLCTKCSICYSACPAALDERFLGPTALSTNYRFIADSREEGKQERLKPLTDNIWLCTSCHSCTIVCPKLVNSSTAIVEERSLMVEDGCLSRNVRDVLTSVVRYHNPIGTHSGKRLDWAKDLMVNVLPANSKPEILYFVCCLPAFDLRNQNIAKSMALILNKIGANFANMGTEEWCCGDHIIRLGEKGLFEELATHNLSMFEKFNAEKILTLSPHCYHTFKNDKPYTDAKLNAQHYSQFLAEALEKGKLKLSKPVNKKVTYHDPCFLGKRSGIYEEPRKILHSISGLQFVEMKRIKENSFCCGGGAGRFWTEDSPQEKRPGVDRVKEALELGVEVLATACPFCVATFEDAIKTLDVENKIVVRDILELVAEAI
jgi:succinate dehydrogenase/fumarate reductase iron-sulfur protein